MFVTKISKPLRESTLVRNILIYGASSALSALVPFLLLPVLTKAMSPSEFGVYALFLMFVNLFTIFSGVNSNGAISVNFFKLHASSFSKFVVACYWVTLVSFIILLGIVDLFGQYFSRLLDFDENYLKLAVILGALNAIYISNLACIQSAEKPFLFMFLKLIQMLLEVSTTIVLVVLLANGLQGRLESYYLAIAVISLLSIWAMYKNNFLQISFDFSFIKKALYFGVPLLPHTLSGIIIMFSDRLVLSSIEGNSSVGLYMAAMQISMLMMLFIDPVNKAYAPWLFRKLTSLVGDFDSDLREKVIIVRSTYGYFIVLIMIALLLYLLMDVIFNVLVDYKYHESKICIPYFLCGFVFQGMYYSVTNYLFYYEKTFILSKISMCVSVIGVLLSLVLVFNAGLLGASIAFMLTNLCFFLCVWKISAKYSNMPWFNSIIFERVKYD